jgi:hypothetical protein
VEAGLIVGAVGVGIATLRFLLLALVVVWSQAVAGAAVVGRLANTGSSRLRWAEAVVELGELIAQFGPPSHTGRTQSAAYPFTRLRSDGVWILDHQVPMDRVAPLAELNVTGQLEASVESALHDDDAFAPEHAALATIGLAALRHGHLSCEADAELSQALNELGAASRDHQDWLQAAPDELLDRYTAGLSGTTFGPRFNGSNIREDINWLLTRQPIDDAIDAIAETIGPAEHFNDGSVTLHTAKHPRRTTLSVLDQLRDFPDTHVIIRTPAGLENHGWWNGRRLLLLTPAAGGWQAEIWPNLFTGIAGYTTVRSLPDTHQNGTVHQHP